MISLDKNKDKTFLYKKIFYFIKIVDWAAEVDRICEETQKVLEQTQDIEHELEKERLDGDLLLKLNGKNTATMDDTDGEDIDEDLNIYKVKVDDDLVSSINDTTQKTEENPLKHEN
jgi:hypothetical protein